MIDKRAFYGTEKYKHKTSNFCGKMFNIPELWNPQKIYARLLSSGWITTVSPESDNPKQNSCLLKLNACE